jgi:hypothetical protein
VTTTLPRISIVTPSFNQAQFLEACIESVLSQAYPNLEYIVMDGGSTDGSVDIIRKYEQQVAYWRSEPDGGHYAAVEEGFARSTGEIMAWLNSDDKYCPCAFFKVADIFMRHPDVSWITGRSLKWSTAGRAVELGPESGSFSREKVVDRGEFQSPWICQESTFWRRSLWERAGGGPRKAFPLAGDLELWVRFFRHAPLHFVDTLLGGNRRHPDQRSVRFREAYLREAEVVLAEERARPAPDGSFGPPAPMTPDRESVRRLLGLAGLARSVAVSDEVAMDLMVELGRVTVDRDHYVDANRVHELAVAECRADRADDAVRIAVLEDALRLARTHNTRLEEDLVQARLSRDKAQERINAIERSISWRTAMFVGRFLRPFIR